MMCGLVGPLGHMRKIFRWGVAAVAVRRFGMVSRQLTVDGGRLAVDGAQVSDISTRIEFVSGGEFVTWWASSRDVVVEDVVSFARCELKRAFGCEPEHFIQCDFCRYGKYPLPFVDGSGLVLWTLVHCSVERLAVSD
jgi:hypothetical protein